MGPARSVDSVPQQHIVTEAYVVCLATGADAPSAQLALYNVASSVRSVLLTNARLAWEGSDPLCGTLELSETPRMVQRIGQPLEGLTFIVRLHNYRTDDPTA